MILKISGLEIIIDEKPEWFDEYWWWVDKQNQKRLVGQHKKTKQKVYFARKLIGLEKGDKLVCDHKNRNPLDNRICNLRKATKQQNDMNRSVSLKSESGLKGVIKFKPFFVKKPWRAYINKDGKCINLGYFKTKEEAGRAYDEKAKELFGEFANLNFK